MAVFTSAKEGLSTPIDKMVVYHDYLDHIVGPDYPTQLKNDITLVLPDAQAVETAVQLSGTILNAKREINQLL